MTSAGSPERKPTFPLSGRPGTGDGSALEIANGIVWLRMPLDKGLDAINIWAIRDGDGWAGVDTGIRSRGTVRAWCMALAGPLASRPIKRILVAHMHPDHCGMAGWLARKFDARLWMTQLEYLMVRVLMSDTGQAPPREVISFYSEAGWSREQIDTYHARIANFGRLFYSLPSGYRRIVDGERIVIGESVWEVIVGQGHSPEHACFYNAAAKLLISGDQVLPKISSNVSVQPLDRDADPLSDWIETLGGLRARVPNDVLVLPAHGEPFHGLHERIDHIIGGHERGLAALRKALAMPLRAVDLFPILFRRPVSASMIGMATGESLAHLAYLRDRGEATSALDEQGVRWWSADMPTI